MDNAVLYHTNNTVQKRDARQCLEEYAKDINWKNGGKVIDIGCGDGSVTTSILKTFMPNNYKELLGCDISEKMVEFANAHYAKDIIRFMVLDIECDLPDQLRENFDHAFSFYTLHWIKQQKIAFSNIYELLAKKGNCLLVFLSYNPVYVVWRELARTPRWNNWMKDVERFVSPYQDCQNPEKDIKIMMTTTGFTNVEVKCLQKVYIYTAFKNAMNAINPFKIPLEMQEDFLNDFVKVVRNLDLVDLTSKDVDGTFNVTINYKLIIAYGNK